LTFSNAQGQSPSYVKAATAAEIPWERYTPNSKRFIVAGEAHHVSSIYPFQLSHIRYLAARGFRHLVWEVPFSYSLIAQAYLDGTDSLLSQLSWSVEDSVYWTGLRALQASLPAGGRLYLWGLDHELGDTPGASSRKANYKQALRLLADGRGPLPSVLRSGYASLDTATTTEAVTAIKKGFQKLLPDPAVAAFFGDRFIDFAILVNRMDHYVVRRNDEMLAAFTEICHLHGIDSTAKFLGRFGWGHTGRSARQSISWLLENDPSSPVRNSTFVVGVYYLNCFSYHPLKTVVAHQDGIGTTAAQKKELAALDRTDPARIRILTWPENEQRKGWAEDADVLFVFSGFPGVTPRQKSQ
ncbi:MAG: hypothetical protein JWP27_1752, partial [Flaviaesturariibacter sp.]|nr:hypothetical protein [Flaviaesturariibacter sp.]